MFAVGKESFKGLQAETAQVLLFGQPTLLCRKYAVMIVVKSIQCMRIRVNGNEYPF